MQDAAWTGDLGEDRLRLASQMFGGVGKEGSACAGSTAAVLQRILSGRQTPGCGHGWCARCAVPPWPAAATLAPRTLCRRSLHPPSWDGWH